MFLHLVACMNSSKQSNSDAPTVLIENYLDEDVLYEDYFKDHSLYEEYLEEKLLIEDIISETLLYEEIIEEVHFVETILIPEDRVLTDIDITLINELFGHDIELSSLIAKLSIGTGVVITLTILSTAVKAGPIAALVVNAAKGAQYGAGVGAISGTISGSLLGISDAIDESGRTSALIDFGLSITGLILSTIVLPSFMATAGIPMLIMAAGGLLSTVWSSYKAYETLVDTYKATESTEIDWDNIDWDGVGYSSASRAIEGAVDGMMIGAIVGAVYGAARSVTKFKDKTVIQDNSTFDPNHIDGSRRTNTQRMAEGHPPVGHDGRPVNIHHIEQTNTGAVMEIQESIHKRNHSALHRNTGQMPSQINRPEFNIWREDYWKWRATQFP